MRQRDNVKSKAYFKAYIESKSIAIAKQLHASASISDITHLRQLWIAIYVDELELCIAQYSAGEDITGFVDIIDALDSYQKLPGSEQMNVNRLSDYIQCLWLLSIAYLLKVDIQVFNRTLTVINLSGKDAILVRLIRLRIPEHIQAETIVHPSSYLDLFNALNTTGKVQLEWLRSFTDNYYKSIKNVYWMVIDPEKGNYFGRWLFELAAFVKGGLLKDESIINNSHYPKDLV